MVETLSARFHAQVELEELHLSIFDGLQVEGTGLRVFPLKTIAGAPPLLTIRSFQFRTGLRAALEPVMRVNTVHIQGAELHIPAKEDRGSLLPESSVPQAPARDEIVVDRLVFDEMRVVIETHKPGKTPLTFEIANITLTNVARTQPFSYDATLRNPKPVGDVRAAGHFGPWQADVPRETPLDGSYIFAHADLSTIKGLGGTLASNGHFAGTLNQIVVDGTSDTPDFRLTTSGHALPLHTDFHVIVDGTSGDTSLQPVHALLGRSHITATGSVVHQKGVSGHDVELDITLNNARLDDLLTLGVRTYPPVVRGTLTSRARVSIPPGQGTVSRRMRLQGTFDIEEASFTNQRLQQQIDDVSERAQGWPEKANRYQAAAITSSMKGSFHLEDEVMSVPEMVYSMPGATVQVEGQYGLDGSTMDFHGTVRTQATASEMVGGWRGLLVMPFDQLLRKNGSGMEVPFKLNGTQKDPKLALDFDRFKMPSRQH